MRIFQRRRRGTHEIRADDVPQRSRMGGFVRGCKRPLAAYPAKTGNSGLMATVAAMRRSVGLTMARSRAVPKLPQRQPIGRKSAA